MPSSARQARAKPFSNTATQSPGTVNLNEPLIPRTSHRFLCVTHRPDLNACRLCTLRRTTNGALFTNIYPAIAAPEKGHNDGGERCVASLVRCAEVPGPDATSGKAKGAEASVTRPRQFLRRDSYPRPRPSSSLGTSFHNRERVPPRRDECAARSHTRSAYPARVSTMESFRWTNSSYVVWHLDEISLHTPDKEDRRIGRL